MVRVSVQTSRSLAVGRAEVLFEKDFHPDCQVAPDGDRFLMLTSDEASPHQSELQVVVNWFEEVKRRVPVK